jgi:hypothetical protein
MHVKNMGIHSTLSTDGAQEVTTGKRFGVCKKNMAYNKWEHAKHF